MDLKKEGGAIPEGKKRVTVSTTFTQFSLPPVRDALIVGRKSPIGSQALYNSLEVLLKGQFKLISVEHPIIEALIVRRSDLRKVPQEKFVPLLIETAEKIMDETDCLRVDVNIEVSVTKEIAYD